MKMTREFDMDNPVDRAAWIWLALREAGLTTTDIAQEVHVTQKFVSDVINSRRSSLRVREHIAGQIRQPIDTIWPQQRRVYP